MRQAGRIVSVAVTVAVAVNDRGRREVLGMAIGASEAETFWTGFLRSLTRRGLRGVKLVIAADHKGLKAAATRILGATAQRCRVHFMRNLLAHAGKQGRRVVSAFVATAFAQDDADSAAAQWRLVADQLKPKAPKLAALTGMAEALEEQQNIADIAQLGFDDRLAMLIEREAEHRDQKSYLGHLRAAQLRIRADIQDVDCRAGRGIARTTLTQLAAGDWIRQGLNLIVGGATGSGKTFVACALAHQACRQKQSVLYQRVPELITALVRARDKGTHARLMGRLARVSLLVLDDWGLQGFSAEGRRDLLEIAEARHGRKSILIASQIPVENWPEVIGEGLGNDPSYSASIRAVRQMSTSLTIQLFFRGDHGLNPRLV